jgi:iron complex outermembrane receptor protein
MMRKKRRIIGVFAFGIVLLLLPTCGDAQHEHRHDTVAMDELVVKADRIQDYIQKYPNLVEQVNRQEIEKRNILSIQEALRTLPGVDVKESTGLGARISIRGSGKASGVLVLLNGRPLNSSQYGSTDLSGIPIELVESVTVFKPPVPVWLGPGGSEGAINIVTRAPTADRTKQHWTKIRAGAGSYGLAEGSFSYRRLADSGAYSATAGLKHREGKRTNSDRHSSSLTLHWDQEYSERLQINVDGRFYASEHGSSGPSDNPTPDARQDYAKGSLDGRIEGLLGAAWDYTFNLYADKTNLEDKSQSGATSTLDSTKWGAKTESTWSDVTSIWELRFNAIAEGDDVDHTLTGEHYRGTTGLGVQAYRHWQRFTATLGVRGDHTSDFGTHPGITGGLSFKIAQGWNAKINAGHRVNIPTFGQLYQPSHGSMDQVRGNPNLEEERIFSFDISLEYRWDKSRLFQLSVFRNEIHDPIVYQRGTDRVYQPINADKAVRQGMEATITYQWQTGLILDLNAVVQASRLSDSHITSIGSDGKELPYTPSYKLKGTLQYTLPVWATRLESTIRHSAARFSEMTNDDTQRLDAYTTVDLKAAQPFKIRTTSLEWFLTIRNLFDADYEFHHGYPDDGVRLVTGLNVTI